MARRRVDSPARPARAGARRRQADRDSRRGSGRAGPGGSPRGRRRPRPRCPRRRAVLQELAPALVEASGGNLAAGGSLGKVIVGLIARASCWLRSMSDFLRYLNPARHGAGGAPGGADDIESARRPHRSTGPQRNRRTAYERRERSAAHRTRGSGMSSLREYQGCVDSPLVPGALAGCSAQPRGDVRQSEGGPAPSARTRRCEAASGAKMRRPTRSCRGVVSERPGGRSPERRPPGSGGRERRQQVNPVAIGGAQEPFRGGFGGFRGGLGGFRGGFGGFRGGFGGFRGGFGRFGGFGGLGGWGGWGGWGGGLGWGGLGGGGG